MKTMATSPSEFPGCGLLYDECLGILVAGDCMGQRISVGAEGCTISFIAAAGKSTMYTERLGSCRPRSCMGGPQEGSGPPLVVTAFSTSSSLGLETAPPRRSHRSLT